MRARVRVTDRIKVRATHRMKVRVGVGATQ